LGNGAPTHTAGPQRPAGAESVPEAMIEEECMKSSAEVGLEKIAQETIEEARVVLPGIQALFGFQLIAVFNERFQQLSAFEQLIHFTALLLIASAIGLIMTPAAYHRIAERSTVSKFFITLSSWLIAGAMVPLMLAICLEVYLLGRLVLG